MAKKRKQEDEEHLEFSEEEDIKQSEAKLHKAKQLLSSVMEDVDAQDLDKSLISTRILKATAQAQGRRLYEPLAARIDFASPAEVGKGCSHYRGSPVCIAISPCGRFVYSGWSTGAVRKYDRKLARVINHFPPSSSSSNKALTNALKTRKAVVSPVTALALSPSGAYLVVGRKDGVIDLYDAVSHKPGSVPVGVFSHRAGITALCFGPEDTRVYSASQDRTIKVWQVSTQESNKSLLLSFLDTLHGHQDAIPCLSSIGEDRCLSVGGRDRTARLWKIVEESQLLFRSTSDQQDHQGQENVLDGDTLECISALSDARFVTGADSLAVWSHGRKKPVFRLPLTSKAISMCILPGCDLLAVGTVLGQVLLYQYTNEELLLLHTIDMSILLKANNESNDDSSEEEDNRGLVNSLAWAFEEDSHSITLAVAYAREGRLDRVRVASVPSRVYTFTWSLLHPSSNPALQQHSA